ncbi:MAG TPA: hypothetical protein VHE08_02915 [Solirubrobacterales bacterium]|nr:hypothetical protein [Solirubrobacterales bacterium]
MIWEDYILLAENLAEDHFEASRRTAVSRAYYGAFNPSRRWVEANVGPIENRAAHKYVWRTFKRPDHASEDTRIKWKLVGDLGDTLRVLRNQADYADSFPGLERYAAEAVGIAERILALLPELEFAD